MSEKDSLEAEMLRKRRGRPPRKKDGTISASESGDGRTAQSEDADLTPSAIESPSGKDIENDIPSSPTPNTPTTKKRGRPRKNPMPADMKEEKVDGRKRKRERKETEKTLDDQTETEEDQPEEAEESDGEIDLEGETKVNEMGEMLGGRKWKVPVFQLVTRGDKWYMLTMDAAKALGYRDSYLLFLKNPSLKRVWAQDDEKSVLVERGLLMPNFRQRGIGIIATRQIFKTFGHKIVKGGKRKRDDYYSSHMPDEPELYDFGPENDQGLDYMEDLTSSMFGSHSARRFKQDALSRHMASSRMFSTSTPQLTTKNWMYYSAMSVRDLNHHLRMMRAERPIFFDVHTNIEQRPQATQPTRVYAERIGPFPKTTYIEPIKFQDRPYYSGPIEELEQEQLMNPTPLKANNGHVQSTIDNDFKEDLDSKYPLALMEGQFQATFSIYSTRFNDNGAGHTHESSIPPVPSQFSAPLSYQQPTYSQYTPAPATRTQTPPQPLVNLPTVYSRAPTVQHQDLFSRPESGSSPMSKMIPTHRCGVMTHRGHACKRPVPFLGTRCQYHQGIMLPTDPPPQKMNGGFVGAPLLAPSVTPDGASASMKRSIPMFVPPPSSMTASTTIPLCGYCGTTNAPKENVSSNGSPCNDSDTVSCTKCHRIFHPVCANLSTARQVAAVHSYPWECEECKVCVVCKETGDEATLVFCDDCDRAWHTGCCTPKVAEVPEGSWLCTLCADCHTCGKDAEDSHNPGKYRHAIAPSNDNHKFPTYLATFCQKCFANFEEDRFCPVCVRTYSNEEDNADDENDMIACDMCDRWVHVGCDEKLTPERYQELVDNEALKYICPLCENRVISTVRATGALNALKGYQPAGYSVGLIGGKVKTRGVAIYNGKKVGIPEISGTGSAWLGTP